MIAQGYVIQDDIDISRGEAIANGFTPIVPEEIVSVMKMNVIARRSFEEPVSPGTWTLVRETSDYFRREARQEIVFGRVLRKIIVNNDFIRTHSLIGKRLQTLLQHDPFIVVSNQYRQAWCHRVSSEKVSGVLNVTVVLDLHPLRESLDAFTEAGSGLVA
jgi:hypothetical protein